MDIIPQSVTTITVPLEELSPEGEPGVVSPSQHVDTEDEIVLSVLLGGVFDPEIAEKSIMKELLEIIEFQKWNYLFALPVPSVFEEVANFYGNFIATKDDTLMVTLNRTDVVLDEEKLSEILGVPTNGLRTVK
ncbi:hypothetical protein RND71_038604 [Anisodus tanguticus]|uniref:Uncharacterized protein n=1 Tax=Anisodus tanguticus TaxID=243964 RepID=A0AAE1US95_9SOLA|nr:hypothetical protein RND71_038604 [Anisodus tanguticus]